MRRHLVVALVLASVAGCATRAAPYGSFVDRASMRFEQNVAQDVVQQLIIFHPPARTRFNFQHATADSFGTALVTALRSKGYALQELSTAVATGAKTVQSTSALPMRYVFDQAPGASLYRVSVYVGNQSLARAYLIQDDTLVPAGAWSRRE